MQVNVTYPKNGASEKMAGNSPLCLREIRRAIFPVLMYLSPIQANLDEASSAPSDVSLIPFQLAAGIQSALG